MQFVDTHAHPHMEGYGMDEREFIAHTAAAGVDKIICVGTSAADSRRAIEFASRNDSCLASVGLHPHDATLGSEELAELKQLTNEDKVVAIGECGLDYYYENSPPDKQRQAFEFQVELALENGLPLIFHVRNAKVGDSSSAFDDFFETIDRYQGVRGVVHSFTSTPEDLKRCLDRGLYIGLNGIVTFTKDKEQLETFKKVPLSNLLLETDAPFLTPVPYRGTINYSAYVGVVAEFLSQLRDEPLEQIAAATTRNAQELFSLWRTS